YYDNIDSTAFELEGPQVTEGPGRQTPDLPREVPLTLGVATTNDCCLKTRTLIRVAVGADKGTVQVALRPREARSRWSAARRGARSARPDAPRRGCAGTGHGCHWPARRPRRAGPAPGGPAPGWWRRRGYGDGPRPASSGAAGTRPLRARGRSRNSPARPSRSR